MHPNALIMDQWFFYKWIYALGHKFDIYISESGNAFVYLPLKTKKETENDENYGNM
jgi:hypothetical protein